jgi:hypothetical protein
VAADHLRRTQRFLGRVGIAAQDVPRTRNLQHDGGQSVSHEVVHVTRDPTPLGMQRLLVELTLRGRELRRQLRLAGEAEADDPREGMPMTQIATAISDGS